MFEAIGAAIFVLFVAFALWYCGMYLMYLLWNNKYARKARKEAIGALINAEKFLYDANKVLCDIEEKEVNLYDM